DQLVNEAYRHCGLYAHDDVVGFRTSAGAVTLILESRESVERRGGRTRTKLGRCAAGRATTGETVQLTDQIWREIGEPRIVVSSGNETWIDRAEQTALS